MNPPVQTRVGPARLSTVLPVGTALVVQPSDAALLAAERLEEEEATDSRHARPLHESSADGDTAPD